MATSQFERSPFLISKQYFIAPPPKLEFFHFGYSETIADSLWLRAIQDLDFCEAQVKKNECIGKGWLFQILDAATTLSPLFKTPYEAGALALTIVISDYKGASRIFDKAVLAFPSDWKILYRASYHALYEEKDKQKAARLSVRAAQSGGPVWLYSLATRLYTEAGEKELGLRLYQDLKEQGEDPIVLARMREKLGIRE